MRIVLDLQGAQTESRYRGIGRQAMSLARALITKGGSHDIHVLLNRRLDHRLDAFSELLPASNIHIFETPGAVAERDRHNLWRTYAAEHVREAAIAAIGPDILHIASLFEGFVDDAVTSIGRFDARHATAVTLHDLIPLADPSRYLAEEGPRLHWLRRAQYLKRADLLLSVSEHSRREAMQRLHIPGERISVISAGIESQFRPASLTPVEEAELRRRYQLDGAFILYVGAVDPRKNVELIFDAFGQLPEAIQEGHLLVFAGRLFDEEIGRLKIVAARHGIPATQLRFCQQVPEEDLVRLYGACAAFVFPSLHEGFGLPALEAMACGAPTLAADATSLREVVGNPDYMFDPLNAESLATRLAQVLTDEDYREAARSWGLARSAEFSWGRTAERTLDAFEALHDRRQNSALAQPGAMAAPPLVRKPLMAFVSPLPGDQTGIADYSAELLPELARHYEIECIVSNTVLDNEWIRANFVLRDVDFFKRNSARYDRIVYSIGNSHFHAHMFDLMQRFPGVVILHDFYLSNLIDWMSNSGQAPYEDFFRALYRSHGLTGLLAERRDGRLEAVARFPCNSAVFEAATGIIVHSSYAIEQTRRHYGDLAADSMTLIPHLRAIPPHMDRAEARLRLGLPEDAFVVCSFGVITERKLTHILMKAWKLSKASRRPGARLVVIGDNASGDYGVIVEAELEGRDDIVVTGYAAPERYRDYLNAADLAVQLRVDTRGETSGAVLDCLAVGVPVIVNNHGASAELPKEVVHKLPDVFTVKALAAAIDRFAADPTKGEAQAARGLAHLAEAHHPAMVGEAFHAAIERYRSEGSAPIRQALLAGLGDFTAPVYPDHDDFRRLSSVIAAGQPWVGLQQILYDVTVLAESDAKTGIQRVVRGILVNLIENPPAGYRIEPVRMDENQFRYARRFASDSMGLPSWVLPDDPVDYGPNDLYLSIDWVPDRLPHVETWLTDFRRAGGRNVIGVHDLLPLQLPQYFPDYMPNVTRQWFETALRVSDQFVCVSRSVADDVARFGRALKGASNQRRIGIDYFHNAADLSGSLPSTGRPDDADAVLAALRKSPAFLMVGTVEPRKGHIQVFRGFEQLWAKGVDVSLVIVGKMGWMMEAFAESLERHPLYGKKLFWLRNVSDEYLEDIYKASTALIAASMGEGFGLPLIEAAKHGLPLIARGIPVFKEVAGSHALYFDGEEPESIANAIVRWLDCDARGETLQTTDMPVMTWRQSTDQLLERVFGESHYRQI